MSLEKKGNARMHARTCMQVLLLLLNMVTTLPELEKMNDDTISWILSKNDKINGGGGPRKPYAMGKNVPTKMTIPKILVLVQEETSL